MMFDVAVIGAGPGGSIAANTCAKKKLKTVLIEKMPLPRDKPCGGWLSPAALQIIRENFGKMPENLRECRIDDIILLPDCQLHQRVDAVSVQRKSFDHWLAQSAEESGAAIYNATLKSLSIKRDHIILKLECNRLEQEITAKYVIGADGLGSTVRSSLYSNLKPQFVEAYQAYVEGQLPREAVYVHFPLDEARVTFFWVIPKKENVVVGVGGLPPIDLKRLMQNFLSMAKEKYKLGKTLKYEAYPIPVFSPANLRLGKRRTFLVGDAACLANPFTGEGIYGSLMSGMLAGESIAENFDDPSKALRSYRQRLKPLVTKLKEMHSLCAYYQSLNRKERQSFVKDYFEIDTANIEPGIYPKG